MPRPVELIFTCEHASPDLPPRYGSLGVRHEQQTSHASWDPGAHDVVKSRARGRHDCQPYHGASPPQAEVEREARQGPQKRQHGVQRMRVAAV